MSEHAICLMCDKPLHVILGRNDYWKHVETGEFWCAGKSSVATPDTQGYEEGGADE